VGADDQGGQCERELTFHGSPRIALGLGHQVKPSDDMYAGEDCPAANTVGPDLGVAALRERKRTCAVNVSACEQPGGAALKRTRHC
jgi:hypothetical protein